MPRPEGECASRNATLQGRGSCQDADHSMHLYIVRHADAGDRKQWNGDDAERPLSELGDRQARALGQSLRQRGVNLEAVVASPLIRTRQTAEDMLGAWPGGTVQFSDLLAPGALRRRKLAKFLTQLGVGSVAIVGHDPDLPLFLGWLLGTDLEQVHLEKGGVA